MIAKFQLDSVKSNKGKYLSGGQKKECVLQWPLYQIQK